MMETLFRGVRLIASRPMLGGAQSFYIQGAGRVLGRVEKIKDGLWVGEVYEMGGKWAERIYSYKTLGDAVDSLSGRGE